MVIEHHTNFKHSITSAVLSLDVHRDCKHSDCINPYTIAYHHQTSARPTELSYACYADHAPCLSVPGNADGWLLLCLPLLPDREGKDYQ